jgi:hypothetical protein
MTAQLGGPAVDRQLAFQLGDAPPGGDQLGRLLRRRPGQLTGVDQLLAAPRGVRLIADL